MGVKNLWKLVGDCGVKETPAGKRVAVDTSIWIHQLKKAPESLVYYITARRILKLLFNGVNPVFVFDGAVPELKKQTMELRKQENVNALIRDIVANRKCSKCGKSMRECKHILSLKDEIINEMDEEAFKKIKEHKYNWGELSEDEESLSSEEYEMTKGNFLQSKKDSNTKIASSSKNNHEETNKSFPYEETNKFCSYEESNKSSLNDESSKSSLNEETKNSFSNEESNKSSNEYAKNSCSNDESESSSSKNYNTEESNSRNKSQQSSKTDYFFRRNYYTDTSPLSSFSVEALNNLTKTQKLQLLLSLREKRKLPMEIDNSSSYSFSESQISNVKKRNMVYSLMKEINKDSKGRVLGDCTVFTEFNKYETEKDAIDPNLIEKKFNFSKEIAIPEPEKSLEDLFSENEKDESEYKNFNRDTESDIVNRINQIFNKKDNGNSGITDKLDFNSMKKSKRNLFKISDKLNSALKTLKEMETTPNNDQINYDLSTNFNKLENYRKITEKPPLINLDKDDDFFDPTKNESQSEEISSSEDIVKIDSRSDGFNSRIIDEISTKILSNTDRVQFDYINEAVSLRSEVQRVNDQIIEVLNLFNIAYVESPMESDSQCAYLQLKGIVDGVITEDNDLLLYGASVYKNFFSKSKDILKFTKEEIKYRLNLEVNDLIKISFLLGSDYCVGVKGIGVKKAVGMLDTVAHEDIKPILSIYNNIKAREIREYSNGPIEGKKIIKFFERLGLDSKKMEELKFYIDKLS